MIKNYLTLALKVLRRKPLYTFISLFGISFTLMILMLITSMGDAMFGANKPISDMDRIVFLPTIERSRIYYDTTYTTDTILMDNGEIRYDSTEVIDEEGSSNSTGSVGYRMLDEHLRELENVATYTFLSSGANVDAYLDGRKVSLNSYYTDAGYWEVFDFDFLYGLPFGAADVEEENRVAVITERAAKDYFGQVSQAVLDQEMILGDENFRVIGIVARPLTDMEFIAGDVFVPITHADPRNLNSRELGGPFTAAFKAHMPGQVESIKNQIDYIAENFVMPPEETDYDNVDLFNGTYLELTAGGIMQERDYDRAKLLLFLPIIILLLLFVALPLINLISLNVSRVYERKSEIAVRKAFGADSRDILYQFIFENLVLTFLGGAAGMALAYFVIRYVNANDLLGLVRLSFSFKVFLYFVIVILLFGLLSGLLPAYRMSRTNVANALR